MIALPDGRASDTLLLQPDNPCGAAFPHISVQSISSVDHQRREIDNSLIIDPAVIGDDHDAIRRPNLLIV